MHKQTAFVAMDYLVHPSCNPSVIGIRMASIYMLCDMYITRTGKFDRLSRPLVGCGTCSIITEADYYQTVDTSILVGATSDRCRSIGRVLLVLNYENQPSRFVNVREKAFGSLHFVLMTDLLENGNNT